MPERDLASEARDTAFHLLDTIKGAGLLGVVLAMAFLVATVWLVGEVLIPLILIVVVGVVAWRHGMFGLRR